MQVIQPLHGVRYVDNMKEVWAFEELKILMQLLLWKRDENFNTTEQYLGINNENQISHE